MVNNQLNNNNNYSNKRISKNKMEKKKRFMIWILVSEGENNFQKNKTLKSNNSKKNKDKKDPIKDQIFLKTLQKSMMRSLILGNTSNILTAICIQWNLEMDKM